MGFLDDLVIAAKALGEMNNELRNTKDIVINELVGTKDVVAKELQGTKDEVVGTLKGAKSEVRGISDIVAGKPSSMRKSIVITDRPEAPKER